MNEMLSSTNESCFQNLRRKQEQEDDILIFYSPCCVLNEHNIQFINVHKCQQVLSIRVVFFCLVVNLSVFTIYDLDNKNRVLLTFPSFALSCIRSFVWKKFVLFHNRCSTGEDCFVREIYFCMSTWQVKSSVSLVFFYSNTKKKPRDSFSFFFFVEMCI